MNARSLLTRCEIRFGLLPGIVSVRLHAFWNQTGNAAGMNETEFFKNLGMMGCLLMISVYGPGLWTLPPPRRAS
jgi:uncharacterized membrane protein YphA (DoxX/SURF4 family)